MAYLLEGTKVLDFSRVLAGREKPKPPLAAKILNWLPVLRRIPARILGIGVRPEHVHTPEATRAV